MIIHPQLTEMKFLHPILRGTSARAWLFAVVAGWVMAQFHPVFANNPR